MPHLPHLPPNEPRPSGSGTVKITRYYSDTYTARCHAPLRAKVPSGAMHLRGASWAEFTRKATRVLASAAQNGQTVRPRMLQTYGPQPHRVRPCIRTDEGPGGNQPKPKALAEAGVYSIEQTCQSITATTCLPAIHRPIVKRHPVGATCENLSLRLNHSSRESWDWEK